MIIRKNFFGTSAAAPHVAGVAALMLSVKPHMTGAELKQAIIDGSEMIEIDTPVGRQKVRNLNAYGALHSVGVFDTKAISDTEVAITGLYDVKSDHLMIPATYQGKKVTAIGDGAFKNHPMLKNVIISESITSIGDDAFAGSSVEKVTFFRGEDALKIGDRAFADCDELYEFDVPERVTSIGVQAFADCNNLRKVEIADSLYNRRALTLGDSAFSGCSNLTGMDFPSRVTRIGKSCFQGCTQFKFVYFYRGLNFTLDIGEAAFCNTGLLRIEMPYRLRSIGDSAFAECSELTEVKFVDGTNQINIGSNAFYNCKKLVSVSIPNTVGSIGAGAFRNCSALSEITLWADFTEISDDLFNGCSALENVTIYGKTTNIGNYAFAQCTSLTNIDYAFAQCTSLTNIDLGDYSELQTIGDHAFDSTLIVAIDISDSVTTIGNNAFAWCTRLTSVGISKDSGLTSIGNYAFDNTAISEVYLPDTVTSIGKCAFRNCEFLTSVTLPKNIESIEDGVFYGCANLTEAIIPSGVTSIGESAFGSCEKLDNVVLPSALNYIGVRAFAGCSALSEIDIPKNVVIIGDRAFQFCGGLKYLGFESGSNLSVIPYGMCMNCVQLDRASVPPSVTEIDNYAFYNCYRLKYQPFDCYSDLNEIGSNAFYNCAFTEVVLPIELKKMPVNAFDSCLQLKEIYIANNRDVVQINEVVGEDFIPFADCPILDVIYVYDVRLAWEYKSVYSMLADRIVTVGFDWALVTDSDHISDKYVFDYVFDYERDFDRLRAVVEDQVVNGVLYYVTANDYYYLSYYEELFYYNIPQIVLVYNYELNFMNIQTITYDNYSMGYNIAKAYLTFLENSDVDIYGILADKTYFPVIIPMYLAKDLSFLMGMSHVFGVPVKAVESYDGLYDWKNKNNIYFENWLCFIDSMNAYYVRISFYNNMYEYYASCGFSSSRQYLSEFENKFVIKNTSVITDIAEKCIFGESYDFIDYAFDVDTAWFESNISTDNDHVIIDWYENEWINDSYNALTQEEIESQKERYADILEFYADQSEYISNKKVCYIAQTVTYIDPYI